MIIFTLFGMDKNGQAYSFSNETPDWTLRGARQDSHCFGLCEISIYDGNRERVATVYSWNPGDGYTYDPSGDIARFYASSHTGAEVRHEVDEDRAPSPGW